MFDSTGISELGGRHDVALQGLMASILSGEGNPARASHEADLLAVARDRDRVAFRRLFDHFAPRLRSFLRRLRTPEGTLDDLV